MDSQRVRLLFHGYTLGWLTFKYPNRYSHLREEVILTEVERKLLADIYHLRTIKDSSLAPALMEFDPKKFVGLADPSFEGYIRSVLPSVLPASTINKSKAITKEDKQDMALLLKKMTEEAQERLKNEAAKKAPKMN